MDGRDRAEEQRRSELSRCVRRLPGIPTLVNDILSTLEEIEKRSRVLLEKSTGVRFLDKGEDSKEVTGLIERLREAITQYQVSGNSLASLSSVNAGGLQVSQQQAIYDQITNLTVRISPFSL